MNELFNVKGKVVVITGKRKLCLPVNYISFCMKIPNRNVYVVHKLLPP